MSQQTIVATAAEQLGIAGPFPGLRPFKQSESLIFFGRDTQVDQLLELLRRVRFLGIIGSSGCGKSSLAKAGMYPALHAGRLLCVDVPWADASRFPDWISSRWFIADMRPGAHPFRGLAQGLLDSGVLASTWDACDPRSVPALAARLQHGPRQLLRLWQQSETSPSGNLLIVADQFEELFRFRDGDNFGLAQSFVSLLLELTKQDERPIHVAITMRSDFLGECSQFLDLPETLNRGQFLVPRLTAAELREAIVAPARLFGVEMDPLLVTRMLNDIGNDSDQLPLLQHALKRTWDLSPAGSPVEPPAAPDTRRHPPLTLADYDRREIGGVTQALDRHAEELFRSLAGQNDDEGDKRLARILFQALTLRDDGRDVRRPAKLNHVAEIAGVEVADVVRIVDLFRDPSCCFLMPPADRPLRPEVMLDISHESLLRQWRRLQNWIAAEAESATNYLRLVNAVRDQERTLDGPRLDRALRWREHQQPTSAWAMRYDGAAHAEESLLPKCLKLIDASKQAKEQSLAEQQAAAERERRLLEAKAQAEEERARLAEEKAALARDNAEQSERLRDEQTQRAQEAEAAAARFQLRTKVALLFLAIAVACGASAVWTSVRANRARKEAEEASLVAASERTKADRNRLEAEQERDRAERALASGYVRSLGHQHVLAPLNPIELNVLWELAMQDSERIRALIAETGLTRETEARHLRRRLEVALQAALGLREDRRQTMRDMVIAKLQNPGTSAMLRDTSVDVGLAMRETDPVFSKLALEHHVERESNLALTDEQRKFLASHVGPDNARIIAQDIVDSAQSDVPYIDASLYPVLSVLLKKVSPEDATRLAAAWREKLLNVAASRDSDETDESAAGEISRFELIHPTAQIAAAYASIANFLEPDDAKRSTAEIISRLGKASTQAVEPLQVQQLAVSIQLVESLPSAQGDTTARQRLIERLRVQVRELANVAPPEEDTPEIRDSASVDDPMVRLPDLARRLWELTESVVKVQGLATEADLAEMAGEIAQACLNALEADPNETSIRMQSTSYRPLEYYDVEMVIEAFASVAPFLSDTSTHRRLIEKLRGASSLDLPQTKAYALGPEWFYLFCVAMDQSQIPAEESQALWQSAADSLFADGQVPDWLGRGRHRLSDRLDLDEQDRDWARHQNALRQLAKHAPEGIADQLQPYLSGHRLEVEVPADELLDQLIQQLDFYHLGPIGRVAVVEESLAKVSLEKRLALARVILTRVVGVPIFENQREEMVPPVRLDSFQLPDLGMIGEGEYRSASAMRSFGLRPFAHLFAHVADTLDANESAEAARMILDFAQTLPEWTDSTNVEGLTKMLIALAPRLSKPDAIEMARRIAARFETFQDFYQQLGMLHAFREFVREQPRDDLVELLKWPNCVAYQRAILLAEIGSRPEVDQDFGSVWEFVAWAREHDAKLYDSLSAPPSRPTDEEFRSGPRWDRLPRRDALELDFLEHQGIRDPTRSEPPPRDAAEP